MRVLTKAALKALREVFDESIRDDTDGYDPYTMDSVFDAVKEMMTKVEPDPGRCWQAEQGGEHCETGKTYEEMEDE